MLNLLTSFLQPSIPESLDSLILFTACYASLPPVGCCFPHQLQTAPWLMTTFLCLLTSIASNVVLDHLAYEVEWIAAQGVVAQV